MLDELPRLMTPSIIEVLILSSSNCDKCDREVGVGRV